MITIDVSLGIPWPFSGLEVQGSLGSELVEAVPIRQYLTSLVEREAHLELRHNNMQRSETLLSTQYIASSCRRFRVNPDKAL